jgi:sodium/potassium-transporting ATPase subunit alpha
VPELVPYLAFVLLKIPLPLTVIQILAVDLGTDMLPALALGAEKPAADVMARPPRPKGEALLHWPLLVRAYLFLGLLEAATALAAFFFVLRDAGWRYGEQLAHSDPLYLQATTACLAGIVLCQVANVFLCRHPRTSILSFAPLPSALLYWGVAAELTLLLNIVYTPAGNRLFGTAAIGLDVWLHTLPFVGAMVVAEEARKALARVSARRSVSPRQEGRGYREPRQ